MRTTPGSIVALGMLVAVTALAGDGELDAKEMAEFVKELEAEPVHDLQVHAYDARKGPDDARVKVFVFSDFQCRPYCAKGADIARDLVEEHGDRIQFVFKNYPLNSDCNDRMTSQMHGQACAAAVGAQCAGEQGRFWEFHDGVFATEELSDETFPRIAREIGLDVNAWSGCLANGRALEQVRAQAAEGVSAGVTGTPSWYIGGRKLSGSHAAKVDAIIRWELARSDSGG